MGKRDIEIIVNGFKEKVPGNFTMSQMIEHMRERDVHLIVELNGRFLYPQKYHVTRVENGDIIEFINPNFGG